MIRIIIADDHKIVTDGLCSLIENVEDISVVDQAHDGKQVLSILESNQIDVAVLDIEMPEKDGVELTKIITKKHPNIRILILTMYNDIGFIRRILEAGAHGYILKNTGKDELILAIRTLHSGEDYISSEVNKTIISSMKNNRVEGEVRFTKREVEVLKLIALGKTTPQIALELSVAKTTIETHRRNLIDKTGLSNSKELVAFAYKNGYTN